MCTESLVLNLDLLKETLLNLCHAGWLIENFIMKKIYLGLFFLGKTPYFNISIVLSFQCSILIVAEYLVIQLLSCSYTRNNKEYFTYFIINT